MAPPPRFAVDAMLGRLARWLRMPGFDSPACARLYWEGSHTRRMRAALDRALPGWLAAP